MKRKGMTVAALAAMGIGAAAGSAHAGPTCEQLNRSWVTKYASDFGVTWESKGFSCPSPMSKIALAMHDLETLELEPNGRGFRPDFYKISTRNLKALAYDGKCAGRGGYAQKALGRVTLCQNLVGDKYSREYLAVSFVHEGRHLEADDKGHEPCRSGKFAGQPQGCDEAFYNADWKGGGFNASIYFYLWNIRRGTARNELKKNVLQSFVNQWLPERFNKADPAQVKKWRELK